MWVLTCARTGKEFFLLPEKEKYSVGRSAADLILPGDASISRLHASICVFPNYLKIVDLGSKYGTYYNNNIESKNRMDKDQPIELRNGERIQFGLLGNEWRLSDRNICTLISTLSSEQKNVLGKYLNEIGGKITESWTNECTHLTMPEITVTVKLLQALVDNIPIVTVEYWKRYSQHLRNCEDLPNPKDYLPKVAELFLNKENISFHLNENRKTLFSEKIFVFMGKKLYDRYNEIIQHAGGVCKSLREGVEKTMLIKSNVIVIQNSIPLPTQTQLSQTVDTITGYITANGRRLIPDREIGLSILYCSTNKYCNPSYDIVQDFVPQSNSTQQSNLIIASATPLESYFYLTNDPNAFEVPESLSCKNSMPSDEEIEFTDDFEVPETLSCTNSKANDVKVLSDEEEIECSNENVQSVSVVKTFSNRTELQKDEQIGNKRRHSISQDENLNKKQHIESKDDESNRFVTNKKQVSAHYFNDFLDKSKICQTEKNKQNIGENNSQSESSKSLKRLREYFADSDKEDDDDTSFKFSASTVKKVKQMPLKNKESRPSSSNQSNPNTKNNNPITRIAKNIQNQSNQLPPKEINPQLIRKEVAFEPPLDGWLSASFNKMKFKSDIEIKPEKYDEETRNWIDSIKGAFEVRIKQMNITSRSFHLDNDNMNDSDTTKSNGKNFKAFVKKRNYKPQTEIIKTVPVSIGNKFVDTT